MATLTGHAMQSWGHYSVLIPNGPSKAMGLPFKIQERGECWGDPFEVSSYRKEDAPPPLDPSYDVVQYLGATKPRGHQFATGFLITASGLSNHGTDSTKPIPYVHIDIAPSACENMDFANGKPTGCTVATLAAYFLF